MNLSQNRSHHAFSRLWTFWLPRPCNVLFILITKDILTYLSKTKNTWFPGVMFYKVAANSETGNNAHWWLLREDKRLLEASGHKIVIKRLIYNLVHRCFYLKTPYLMRIVESLTLNSEPKALKLMPELSPCNTHFLKKAYHMSFLS